MKKIILTSVLSLTLLSSCSGPDKNEKQPKLGAAGRSPVNQTMTNSQAIAVVPAGQQAPVMIDQQPAQPEIFLNQSVGGISGAPAVTPDALANQQTQQAAGLGLQQPVDQQQFNQQQAMEFQAPVVPQPQQMPVQMAAPQPIYATPAPTQLPTQVAGNNEPIVIATISKNRRLPASLQPTYNNPLNYVQVPAPIAQFAPAVIQPAAMGAQPQSLAPQYSAPQQIIAQPQAPTGMPAIQSIYTPTQPVDQMQLYTTQPAPNHDF